MLLTPTRGAPPSSDQPPFFTDPELLIRGTGLSISGLAFNPHAVGTPMPSLTPSPAQGTPRGDTATQPAAATPVATASPAPSPTFVGAPAETPAAAPVPTASAAATPTPAVTPATAVDHVFIVVMENHAYDQTRNTSSTPYTTALAIANAVATDYWATDNPSLPNYLDLFAGGNYGITSNCNPSASCHIDAPNLADSLDAAGLTWMGYFEDMPSPCYLGDESGYVAHHNPFIYFDDIRTNATRCATHVVNYTALAGDLAAARTTPTYALIVPNNCHNTHDCSIRTGDTWLSQNLPPILASPACTAQRCLVILTWDEDDGSQNNHVLTVFAGSAAWAAAASAQKYSHYSLLRTVEDLLGLSPQTGNDGNASPMSDLLR